MDSYTLKELLKATEDHAQLPERALKLSLQTAEHAYGAHDRDQLLKGMAGILTRNLPKNPTIPAPIQVSLIKKLYSKGRPLEHHPLYWADVKPDNAHFIAAMYYLAQSSTFHLDSLMKVKLRKVITEIAFAQGKHWDALKPALESVDRLKRSYGLLESVPDILANLDKHLQHEHDAVYLQKCGGVERLKVVGANLDAICKSFLKSIAGTRLSPDNLLLAHQLLMEVTQELLGTGKITRDEAKERHGRVMVATLGQSERKPNDPNGCYRQILLDLAPHIGIKHGSEYIPSLTRLLSLEEIAESVKDPLSVIEPAQFKRALRRRTDAEKRYDLVVALGVHKLFSSTELNKLKAEKLESMMGL